MNMNRHYPIAVVEVPPARPPRMGPPLYGVYKELLEAGLTQRGPLVGSRFWRASVLGDLNVFRGDLTPSGRIRANAILLWDWSGSQRGYYSVLVAGLSSILQALTQLRFRTWAAAYTGTGEVALEIDPRAYVGGTLIGVVKGLTDTYSPRRVATLEDFTSGGTPTGPALQYVRQRVIPLAGQGRKTLVVVATDGEADNVPYQQLEVRRIAGIRDVTLVALYCGPAVGTFVRMKEQFPHCFWAPDRAKIPAAFAHTLRAFRGGL